MKTSKTFLLGAVLAAFALGTFAPVHPTSAGSQDVKLKTDLDPVAGDASGNAKWEKRGTGSCTPLEADRCKTSIEGEDFNPNTAVTITINCTPVQTFLRTTDENGFFDLNLDTDRGDQVSDCVQGTELRSPEEAKKSVARLTQTKRPTREVESPTDTRGRKADEPDRPADRG